MVELVKEVIAVMIVASGREHRAELDAEMFSVFSWSELPELLAAEDLFDQEAVFPLTGASMRSAPVLSALGSKQSVIVAGEGDEDDFDDDEDDDFDDDEEDEGDDEEDEEEEEDDEEWEEVDDEEEDEEEDEEDGEGEEEEEEDDEDWEDDDEDWEDDDDDEEEEDEDGDED